MPSYAPLAVLVIAACAHPSRQVHDHVAAPPHVAASPTASSPTPSSEAVLAMLIRRCGECHQSSRPTALPKALAIFDLDDAAWPHRFDAHRFEVALARLGDAPQSDRTLFLTFHPNTPNSQIDTR